MIPWTDVFIAIQWYFVVIILGVIGWALIFPYVKTLPAKGYLVGKATGLILVSAITWILSVLHIANFSVATVLVTALAIVFVAKNNRQEILRAIRSDWKQLFLAEVVSVALFVIGVVFRSHKPAISDIEKYMDIALLNAILRTSSGVPIDPWYAGATINYYYFGHWMIAVIAKLSGTISSYAFNLGTATTIMIAGSNVFLVAWALTRKFSAGALAVFLALFASNVHPFIAWLKETPNYFFFNSGRFIEQVINEYPLYSFVLGDLHAHMLSLILTTSCIVAGYVFLSTPKEKNWSVWALGFLVGLMFATNAFDVINFAVFCSIVLVVYWYKYQLSFLEVIKMGGIFAVSGALPVALFSMNFTSPTGGIGFSFFKTSFLHVTWQFGIFYSIIIFSLVAGWFLFRKQISYLFKGVSGKNFLTWVWANSRSIPLEIIFLVIIFLTAVALVILPEIIFVKDIYFIQNPPFYRANTVFKIWYTAWVFSAITSAVFGAYLVVWLKTKFKFKGKFLGLFLLCIPIIISLFGFRVGWDTLNDYLPNTLDGLDYIKQSESNPQDYEVVKWARENIKGQPVVLEATGQSYSTYDWFSAYTGLPTIIGWESHEWGWRYNKDAWNKIALKMGQVEQIYKAKDSKTLSNLVRDAGISYILISPNEKNLYGAQNEIMKTTFGNPVFDNGKSALYKTGYSDEKI